MGEVKGSIDCAFNALEDDLEILISIEKRFLAFCEEAYEHDG